MAFGPREVQEKFGQSFKDSRVSAFERSWALSSIVNIFKVCMGVDESDLVSSCSFCHSGDLQIRLRVRVLAVQELPHSVFVLAVGVVTIVNAPNYEYEIRHNPAMFDKDRSLEASVMLFGKNLDTGRRRIYGLLCSLWATWFCRSESAADSLTWIVLFKAR